VPGLLEDESTFRVRGWRSRGRRTTEEERYRTFALVSAYQDGYDPPAIEALMREAAVKFASHPDFRDEWRPAVTPAEPGTADRASCPGRGTRRRRLRHQLLPRALADRESFRMSKSDLQARPIYHRKRDSIEARLTIVFAALAVTRWIEARTGWSTSPIPDDLRQVIDAINRPN
jgi:hypothetical protein